jgi:thiol-disulfide isomerase/thioredoxin
MLFGIYCASCHGPDGRGDGPSAAGIKPPPRDFALRPWRYPVTKESIQTVILDGIPGTAMAANRAAIATSDVDGLVEYTYRLATLRPPVTPQLTPKGEMLRDAGFTDLQGTLPPQLTLVDATGKEMKLADQQGKLVLLHFWGANCPHCLKEMPALKALEVELAERGFSVLHVCTDLDDANEAQTVADRFVPGLKIYTESSGLGLARFEVQALPCVWLIAPDGNAIGRSMGARDWSAVALRSLLEEWLPRSRAPGDKK